MTSAAAEQNQTDTTTNYNPIKNQEFNPTPRNIQKRTDLTASAKAIYGYLASCYGRNGLIFPKVSTIANQCGLSIPTVTRAIFTLKQKRLIDTVRTGRASRYIFLDPDQVENTDKKVDQVPEDQPEMTEPVNLNDLSDQSKCSDQEADTPYIEKTLPKEKQTTQPGVVVSLDDVQACLNVIPKDKQTPSIRKIVRMNLESHNRGDVLKAIGYANERATKSYGGYLNLCLKHGWHEDWTPPAPAGAMAAAKTDEEILKEAQADRDALAKKNQQDEHRAALAAEFLKLPEDDRQVIRDKYLSGCSKYERKRSRFMTDGRLSGTVAFRLFLCRVEGD